MTTTFMSSGEIIKEEGPGEDEPAPSHEELCTVPLNQLREADWLEKWRWDHLEKRWGRQFTIAPGMILMLPNRDGGYSSEMGWTGNREDKPELVDRGVLLEEGIEDDPYAATGWQTLAEHNDAIVRELKGIITGCNLLEGKWTETLLLAALWHDTGKVHEVFQNAMIGNSQKKTRPRSGRRHLTPRLLTKERGSGTSSPLHLPPFKMVCRTSLPTSSLPTMGKCVSPSVPFQMKRNAMIQTNASLVESGKVILSGRLTSEMARGFQKLYLTSPTWTLARGLRDQAGSHECFRSAITLSGSLQAGISRSPDPGR